MLETLLASLWNIPPFGRFRWFIRFIAFVTWFGE
jgi:hypothetical protein